jgi:hypothetical protein
VAILKMRQSWFSKGPSYCDYQWAYKLRTQQGQAFWTRCPNKQNSRWLPEEVKITL